MMMKRKLVAVIAMAASSMIAVSCASAASTAQDQKSSSQSAGSSTAATSTASDPITPAASSSSESQAVESSADVQPGDLQPEVTTIKAGLLPTVSSGPFYVAMRDGLFKKYGLDVEVVPAGTGAQAAAALTSDSIQFGYGGYVAFIQAELSGLKFKLAAETATVSTGQTGVIVATDNKSINTAADLKGKRIGTQSLTNYGVLAVRATLQAEGVDPGSYELVQIPQDSIVPTVLRGDIDAAWLPEPYFTQGLETGKVRLLFDPFIGKVASFPSTGIFVSEDFAAKNPNTVKAFAAAISEGARAINSDIDSFRTYVSSYTKTDVAMAEKMQLPTYPEQTDAAGIQVVADLMLEDGMIKEPFDTSVWSIK